MGTVISAMVLLFWVRVMLRSLKAPTKSSTVRVETMFADGYMTGTDTGRLGDTSIEVTIVGVVAVRELIYSD